MTHRSFGASSPVAANLIFNSGVGTQQAGTAQGKYKKPLVGADFYRAVGRADLVKQYEDRGKRQLAEAYNRDLWQKLSSEPHADAVDVHVVPLVEKDGAGVSVAVRF